MLALQAMRGGGDTVEVRSDRLAIAICLYPGTGSGLVRQCSFASCRRGTDGLYSGYTIPRDVGVWLRGFRLRKSLSSLLGLPWRAFGASRRKLRTLSALPCTWRKSETSIPMPSP